LTSTLLKHCVGPSSGQAKDVNDIETTDMFETIVEQ